MNAAILRATIMVIAVIAGASASVPAYAHFDHFSHYNGEGDGVGSYYIYQELEPDYAAPGEPAAIMFSVQDRDGHDTYNIETMVEIYSSSGERLKAFPWTKQDIGDFSLFYTFQEKGSYQIVFSLATGPVNTNAIDPPRTTLGSTLNCNCERVIFNVAISQGFGTIYNSALAVAVAGPLAVFGAVMGFTYKARRRSGGSVMTPGDTMRYIVTLAAIAGGLVHFAVYSEHSSLRIEYSIFLIVAGGIQVTYGIMYTMLTLTGSTTGRLNPHSHYRKTVIVNLFGLVGTAVLLGLYAYAVTLPPPLSPNNRPEDIDVAGVLAKAVEAFTLIGIVYLMRLEKRRLVENLKYPSKT